MFWSGPAPGPSGSRPSAVPRDEEAGAAGQGRTVLLGWELGAGLGHVRRLLPLAHALAAHGQRPVLAVKNLVEPWPALRDVPFPVLQAPVYPPRPWPGPRPFLAAGYADLLAGVGFADFDDLWPMVQAWQALLDLVRPALVVCDHSPTLCLAACGAVPTLVVGNGFTVPPVAQPTFPPLIPGQALRVPEAELLAVVRRVQRQRGLPVPVTLPGLFAASERWVTALPELDP
jgi:hypothetical protein